MALDDAWSHLVNPGTRNTVDTSVVGDAHVFSVVWLHRQAAIALVFVRVCLIFIHKWTKLVTGQTNTDRHTDTDHGGGGGSHPPHSFSPPPEKLQVQATSSGKQVLYCRPSLCLPLPLSPPPALSRSLSLSLALSPTAPLSPSLSLFSLSLSLSLSQHTHTQLYHGRALSSEKRRVLSTHLH